jgi:hypothetical protein
MADVPRVCDDRRGAAGKLRIAAAAGGAPSASAKRSGPPAVDR